ncbi:MAG: hypothetical protein D6682_00625 [Zetaproteobacteria bacterium]|nr:MAG: hypothetical protein D6682_00625 [Zetaproteobacteria bacterium]
MGFAAAIYLLGNGLWANRWVRRRRWLGWLLWLVSCALVLVAGAAIENHLGTGRSILDRLTSVDAENHWIALTLYALMSVPGAASVILGQGRFWTRLALIAVALLIFVPTAFHLGSDIGTPAPAFAIAAALCGLLWLWQAVLDDDPSG